MNATIQKIEQSQIIRKSVPFKVGDTVKVSVRIKEGEKERIQVYEGVVTGIQGAGGKMKFTVRKISYGVGVEKTFYYQSPMIKDVKSIRSGKVRRAKLFYLRAPSRPPPNPKLKRPNPPFEGRFPNRSGISGTVFLFPEASLRPLHFIG